MLSGYVDLRYAVVWYPHMGFELLDGGLHPVLSARTSCACRMALFACACITCCVLEGRSRQRAVELLACSTDVTSAGGKALHVLLCHTQRTQQAMAACRFLVFMQVHVIGWVTRVWWHKIPGYDSGCDAEGKRCAVWRHL